jgi:hypothetical protein
MMYDKLWVHGTCDRILLTLRQWIMVYHTGKVSATGRYLTKPGEVSPEPKEIDVPTRYACDIAWTQSDLEYLIKILEAKVPTWPVTKDLRTNFPKWKYGRLIQGGSRIVTMDVYFTNLVEIYKLIEGMQSGQSQDVKRDLSEVDLSAIK